MKAYITFGQCHRHEVNNQVFDKDCVAVLLHGGRERAFELFGGKWHNAYTEKQWNSGLLEYFPRGCIEI